MVTTGEAWFGGIRVLLAFFLLTLAVVFAPAHAGSVGVVAEVSGEAKLLRGFNHIEAAKGVEVEPADIIATGKDGTVQLSMEDGSTLRIGPNSRLALTDYKLDQDNSVVSAGVDLLAGWLRFAVSKLKKKDAAFNINAPVLTIGIRGTEGVIEAENEQGGLHLETGAVDVSGRDATGRMLPPVRVNAGEYVQRLQGQMFQKLARPPAAFHNRLPPIVQQKIVRRELALKERGVPPRVVRQITREEAKEFIRKHPHAEDRLKQRFHPLLEPGGKPQGGEEPQGGRHEPRRKGGFVPPDDVGKSGDGGGFVGRKPGVMVAPGVTPRGPGMKPLQGTEDFGKGLRRPYQQPSIMPEEPLAPRAPAKSPLMFPPTVPPSQDKLAPVAPQSFAPKPLAPLPVAPTAPTLDPTKLQPAITVKPIVTQPAIAPLPGITTLQPAVTVKPTTTQTTTTTKEEPQSEELQKTAPAITAPAVSPYNNLLLQK